MDEMLVHDRWFFPPGDCRILDLIQILDLRLLDLIQILKDSLTVLMWKASRNEPNVH